MSGLRRRESYQLTIAVAFGCPFSGATPLESCVTLAERFEGAGLGEFALADTIGVAAPREVRSAFEAVRTALGSAVPLRAHFHNTRGLGIANALAAREAWGGDPRCKHWRHRRMPFAPGATGNIATEELLYALERMGEGLAVSLDGILGAAALVEEALERPLPSLVYRAGLAPGGEDTGRAS